MSVKKKSTIVLWISLFLIFTCLALYIIGCNSNYLITIDFNDNKRKYEKIDGQIKIVNKNYINNGEKIKTKEKFHDIL